MSKLSTILFLAANPTDTSRLRLEQELRDISEGLQRSQKRDLFRLEQRLAARPRDIQRAMLDLAPYIVHFSGHGMGTSGLVFENDQGKTQLVEGHALASLFSLFADKVDCVLLNGCYSEIQAVAISQHIKHVIGMNQAIGDRAAIEFAVGFYDALGAGHSIDFAYSLGCSAIQLAGIPEHLTPVLVTNNQLKPAKTKRTRPGSHAAMAPVSLVNTPNQDIRFPLSNTPRSSHPLIDYWPESKREQKATNSKSAQKSSFSSPLTNLKQHTQHSLIVGAGIAVTITGIQLLGLFQPVEIDVPDDLAQSNTGEQTELTQLSETQNFPKEEVDNSEVFKQNHDTLSATVQEPENIINDSSTTIQEPENTINDSSVIHQGEGNQAVIQGTDNNVIQGSNNQLIIQQESEAKSRGELEIPTIYGLSYHQARQELMNSGWTPSTHRHMYAESEPSLQSGNGKVFWDLGYWEVAHCSGSAEAFCKFQFEDPAGRQLVVITAGMEDRSRSVEAQINRVYLEEEELL